MPDNVLDLGSASLFRSSINWRKSPKYDYDNSRKIIGYSGTVKQVIPVSLEKPQIFEFSVNICNKADEKQLMDHFINMKGKHGRFWLLLAVNFFTLVSIHSIGNRKTKCIRLSRF